MNYSVFDSLLDGVYIVDKDKNIVYANEAIATMIGVSSKRLKPGKKAADFLMFNDPEVFLMPQGSWGKNQATRYKEFEFETSKGNKGDASVAITPVEGPEGETHWVHYIKDMSLEIQLQKKYRAELGQKEEVIVDLKRAQAELQRYSKNLEHMVEERTAELKDANKFINTMIDSLGQGLVVFDSKSNCLPIYTKACEEIFASSPKGKKIYEIMDLDEDRVKSFQKWTDSVFSEILPFDDLKSLGPSNLPKVDDRFISLEYYPLKEDDGSLQGVVTVATDKTREHEATKEAEKQAEYVNMILKLVKNKNQFLTFVGDSRKMMERLIHISQPENEQPASLSEVLLLMHSIKGGAGVYSITEIHELAHEMESQLEPYKESDHEKWKSFMPEFNKMVIKLRDELEVYFKEYKIFLGEAIVDGKSRIEHIIENLVHFSNRILGDEERVLLHKVFIESFVKQPAFSLLTSYSDLVIDLAKNNSKEMNPIQFENKNVRIDGDYYSQLFSTLVHAFTNAVIHGLEESEERVESCKSSSGQMIVNFLPYIHNEKNWMKITIEDDGRGINPDIIRKKLIEKGESELLINQTSDLNIIQRIFDESFSTAESVNEVAGRGVGMSAIKKQVEDMGGSILMESISGFGSKLIIDVPDV